MPWANRTGNLALILIAKLCQKFASFFFPRQLGFGGRKGGGEGQWKRVCHTPKGHMSHEISLTINRQSVSMNILIVIFCLFKMSIIII